MKDLLVNLLNLPATNAVEDLRNTLRNLLNSVKPFAVSLSTEQRKKLRKMGRRHYSYVKATLRHILEHEEVLPRDENAADFDTTMKRYEELIVLRDLSVTLTESLDDTIKALGIDLMKYNTLGHNSFKAANDRDPKYDSIVKELDEFNARSSAEQPDELEEE